MPKKFLVLCLAGTLGLAGCSTSATAPTADQTNVALNSFGDVSLPNASGEYAGAVKDNVYGRGRATADLAQYHGALGGALTATYSNGSQSGSAAFILKGDAANGDGDFTVASHSCTFAETATYDAATYHLNGSYRAVRGCSGEHGSFTLRQHCHYKIDAVIGQDTSPKSC